MATGNLFIYGTPLRPMGVGQAVAWIALLTTSVYARFMLGVGGTSALTPARPFHRP